MTRDEFTAYCHSIGIQPHFRVAPAVVYKPGVDYFVALYHEGRACGEYAASEGDFDAVKAHAEYVVGMRRAAPGSVLEAELLANGESIFKASRTAPSP